MKHISTDREEMKMTDIMVMSKEPITTEEIMNGSFPESKILTVLNNITEKPIDRPVKNTTRVIHNITTLPYINYQKVLPAIHTQLEHTDNTSYSNNSIHNIANLHPNTNLNLSPNNTTRHRSHNRRLTGRSKNQKRRNRKSLNKFKHHISNNINNYSSYKLTTNEIRVLNEGLTFCTSHGKLDINKLDTDIRRFERRLQLYYFFKNKNKPNNTYLSSLNNKFQSNPTFWPKKLNAYITKFCSDLQSSIQQLHTYKPNLNKHESKALHHLKSNTQITIKKGDKGAGICILDTIDYVNKIKSMLQDTMVYTQVTEDPTNTTKELADRLIDELFNFNYINKKQQANLQRFKATTPKFYGIPKVHKENIPLRPIVSQTNGPTMKINELVDYYLSVAEKQIPTLKTPHHFYNLSSNTKIQSPSIHFLLHLI